MPIVYNLEKEIERQSKIGNQLSTVGSKMLIGLKDYLENLPILPSHQYQRLLRKLPQVFLLLR